VWSLDDEGVAAELGRLQRNRARDAAREADLILRLAELRPDTDDPPEGGPGARNRTWRKTDPEFPGVSEFFPDEVAHAINLGRGTAAFRARRACTWRENLPATLAALHRGKIDERRAGVLADALRHTTPELARAVEATLLPEAFDLSLARLRARALELLAELDATAVDRRHAEAKRAADVRLGSTGDGMATLAGDMTADEAAACYDLIDQLATMAKADGDPPDRADPGIDPFDAHPAAGRPRTARSHGESGRYGRPGRAGREVGPGWRGQRVGDHRVAPARSPPASRRAGPDHAGGWFADVRDHR
jgi:hypothetical protein